MNATDDLERSSQVDQPFQRRALTAADETGAPVVVVNETMARSVWPSESALGKCIRVGFDPDFDPDFDPPGGGADRVARGSVARHPPAAAAE